MSALGFDLCVVEFRQRNGVVTDQVFYLLVERMEDLVVGGYDGGLMAVTAGEVLRGNDSDGHCSGLNKDNLAVVVGEVGVLDDLREECP